jgi:hypothetical protein
MCSPIIGKKGRRSFVTLPLELSNRHGDKFCGEVTHWPDPMLIITPLRTANTPIVEVEYSSKTLSLGPALFRGLGKSQQRRPKSWRGCRWTPWGGSAYPRVAAIIGNNLRVNAG